MCKHKRNSYLSSTVVLQHLTDFSALHGMTHHGKQIDVVEGVILASWSPLWNSPKNLKRLM